MDSMIIALFIYIIVAAFIIAIPPVRTVVCSALFIDYFHLIGAAAVVGVAHCTTTHKINACDIVVMVASADFN